MAQIQPDAFDLVVIGTGLEESLLAAYAATLQPYAARERCHIERFRNLQEFSACRAAAKCGKTVLQLDQAGHYGSAWSSLTLEQFLSWAKQQASSNSSAQSTQTCKQDFAADTAEEARTQSLLHVDVPNDQALMYSNLELYQQPVDLGLSREFSLDLAGKAGDPLLLLAQALHYPLSAEPDSSHSVGGILCV